MAGTEPDVSPAPWMRGAYLTDGTKLFRVVDGFGDALYLEDCANPEAMPQPYRAMELTELELVPHVSPVVAA